MSLPPYPRYRESGIEWLGEVPDHCKSMRLAELFRETDDVGSEELPVLSVSIHHGVSDREFGEEEQDRKHVNRATSCQTQQPVPQALQGERCRTNLLDAREHGR